MADSVDVEEGIADEAKVIVLDVLFEDSPETASERLSEPYKAGFHIHRAVEWPGGMRVVFVQSVKVASKKQTPTPDLATLAKNKLGAKRRWR